jgi:hypothetical protein
VQQLPKRIQDIFSRVFFSHLQEEEEEEEKKRE